LTRFATTANGLGYCFNEENSLSFNAVNADYKHRIAYTLTAIHDQNETPKKNKTHNELESIETKICKRKSLNAFNKEIRNFQPAEEPRGKLCDYKQSSKGSEIFQRPAMASGTVLASSCHSDCIDFTNIHDTFWDKLEPTACKLLAPADKHTSNEEKILDRLEAPDAEYSDALLRQQHLIKLSLGRKTS
jgi:hypothetical protein